MSRLTVVGDLLLDRDLRGTAVRLCPDAPAPVVSDASARTRPGGAGLAACLAALDGHEVTLVCATGDDPAGREARELLARRGVAVADLGAGGRTPEKTRVIAGGQVVVRLDSEGERPSVRPPGAEVARSLREADAILVSDYGRGMTWAPPVREALAGAEAPLVWDPHPAGATPLRRARLLTPNATEAARLAPGAATPAEQARAIRRETRAGAVAVTLGDGGAVLVDERGHLLRVPARAVDRGDVCGAGDRFAASAAGALAEGASCAEAVAAAVAAATGMIADGGAAAALERDPAIAPDPLAGAERTIAEARARGGRVVTTGGCFDLLHAGHVALLEGARALGDCLVVLLNSDRSVRALKGPGRPLVEEADRARVLAGLRCVDAVAVFDEDTPAPALARLAPDLWAKGGDYDADELPEAGTVRAAGGEVVVLPYIPGRSTTRLITEVAARARA